MSSYEFYMILTKPLKVAVKKNKSLTLNGLCIKHLTHWELNPISHGHQNTEDSTNKSELNNGLS